MKKTRKKSLPLKPGGVEKYIARQPKEIQEKLQDIRVAIQAAAPGSLETMSYFDMPGYSYEDEDFDYSGMFAWFSFKKPFVRLHIRPQAIVKHQKELAGYAATTAIVSFPLDKKIPKALVKKLVKASVKTMKDLARP